MPSPRPSERAANVSPMKEGCEMEIKALGLTELYTSKTPEADIVFVHGHGGSPRKTWVYKGNLRKNPLNKAHDRSIVDSLMTKIKRGTRDPVFWPADILPQDHHDVRIMTYGYQSNRRKFISRTTSKLTISQHGNQFLESIARARHNSRGRPIIFVAHGRGGLIVKQAIVEAKKKKKQRLPELHDIYESFQGVIFLGTPHRSFEDAMRPLTPTGRPSDAEDLKEKMLPGSKMDGSKKQSKLNGLYNDFCDIIIEEEVIRVSNFEETKKKARILTTRKKMASDYFSTFGVRDWERTDVINADRTNMCRFPNREDDDYDKVRNAIGFHLGIKRNKAKDGRCGELSLVDPSNGENMPNWRESNASTIIFDCNGLSHDFKERILQWLHRLTPTKTQSTLRNANLRKLEDGTGTWFLGIEELDRWLNEPSINHQSAVNRMLWFTGEPGVGKSILSCILIDHLEQVSAAATFGFAWFICHGDEQPGSSLSLSIARKLLQQLLKQETNFPASMFRMYKKYEKYDGYGLEPLEEECLELLKSVAAKFPKVYVVVDGLDELSHDSRVHAIKTIEALLSGGAYCAITSRTGEPYLEHSFSKCATRLKIGASEPDIWRYLENHISEPCPLANVISANGQRLREEVIAAISRNSDGMMLLAQQNLKGLSDENTLEGLETAISNLSSNLNDLYMETWDRIKKNNSQKVFERVQQVVMWVAFANRPLTVPELRHALAIRDNSGELNSKALWDTPLDESSLGLIVIDEDQTIRLCHKSAYVYFTTNLCDFPNADETLSKTCLRYLLLDSLSLGDNPEIADIASQAEMYPFHRYAFENWHIHARKQMIAPEVQELAMRFLQDSSKVTISYRLHRYTCYGEDTSMFGFTGMQLIASFDLGEFFMPLRGSGVDSKSMNFRSDTSPQGSLEEDKEEEHEVIGERRDGVNENTIDEGEWEEEVERNEEAREEDEEEEEVEEEEEEEEDEEEEDENENDENFETILPPQGPETDAGTSENEAATPSRYVEERVSEAEVVDKKDSQDEVESDENMSEVEELKIGREALHNMAVECEVIGREKGESSIELNSPTGETGYMDVQKAIRDFLVGEGKIPSREDHDGTQTTGDDSIPEQTPPKELSEGESLLEGSGGGSPEKSVTGLYETIKIPFPHDDTTQTEAQPSDTRTPFPLTIEHRLSGPNMGSPPHSFKLPSILSGRQYGVPSASMKERVGVGALPLYLTPIGEREGLMMKQYSTNSLPNRKGRGAKTRSTSDIYDLDGLQTLPKRNMYLYPTARDRYESMFQAGKPG